MHADEMRLQEELAAKVHYLRTQAEMKEIVQAAAATPNIESQKVRDILYIISCSAEVKI